MINCELEIRSIFMVLIIFLVILSILILIHELGHFLVARRAGIKVDEFGLGFPPRLFAKKYGETVYSLNALPIGGFVKLYGEDEAVEKDKNRSYFERDKLTRAAVIVAGVFMNLILAILAFSIIVWVTGVPEETGRVRVLATAPSTPAESAGIRASDYILEIDGHYPKTTQEFVRFVDERRGSKVKLVLERNGEKIEVSATPRVDTKPGEGSLGVAISSSHLVQPPLYKRPFVAVFEGAREALFWVKVTFDGLTGTLKTLLAGGTPKDLAGPIGIFQITGTVAQGGLLPLISFVGILSVNLALLNIMPVPALDGGRLLFIIVESLFGRRVVPAFERWAHTVGMVLLLLMLLLVTLQDIRRMLGQTVLP